jgi:hypothetical protein
VPGFSSNGSSPGYVPHYNSGAAYNRLRVVNGFRKGLPEFVMNIFRVTGRLDL